MRAAAAQPKETPIAPGADRCGRAEATAKQAGEAAQLLKMLANEKRLLILCFLAVRGEMTVGELVGIVKLSQSRIVAAFSEIARRWSGRIPAESQTLPLSGSDPRALRLLEVLNELYCGELSEAPHPHVQGYAIFTRG